MQTRNAAGRPLRIAIVAAEASGDTLGAALIEALRELAPDAEFFGMAGERMIAAGCEAWNHIDEVSVMGLSEVLPHLPRLLRLRKRLRARIAEAAPDVFIGIDSPDFNLPIESRLKAAGIPTVQYVSPQVWAWRQSRVSGIRAATSLVLCVLPFEVDFFADHDVPARFVGHPLADELPLTVDAGEARVRLGLPGDGPVLAVLPGSRGAEVSRLARPFLDTAAWLQERVPNLSVAVALANRKAADAVGRVLEENPPAKAPHLIERRTRDVLAAADVVLTASGTATLETLLAKRRMVVAHKVSALTYWIVRRMGVDRLHSFSLPNLLCGRKVVPELIQEEVRPEVIGPALLEMIEGRGMHPDWYDLFMSVHRQLRQGASRSAAEAVLELIDRKPDAE